MGLQFGAKTDVGLKRRVNQDSSVIVRGETLNGELDALFVIADGMGGKQGGEVASEIVVKTLPRSVTEHLSARNGDKAPVDAGQLLEDAIRDAHRSVCEGQAADHQLSGMGTTCVAAILDANVLTVANVGDSRAYLLRDGRLSQITRDHSSVWEQVVAGNMTPEEARTSRFRNQITRAIGSEVSAEPDIDIVELRDGDSILLCSDGLYSEVCDDEIARLLSAVADPQAACDRLVAAALAEGGRDNVTVIALRYGEFTPRAQTPMRALTADMRDDSRDSWRASGFEPAAAGSGRASDSERVYREGGRRSASFGVLLLLFALAVAAAGEAYVITGLNRKLARLRNTPPEVVVRAPDRPTDHELKYGSPVVVSPKQVRDAPLAVDEDGSVLAVTLSGSMVRVDSRGQVTPLPDQNQVLERTVGSAHDSLLLKTDLSGNRYQVNPGARVIVKYDADGILKTGDIGLGKLVAPTSLGVDSAGNIYAIDDHLIKKIPASLAADGPTDRRTNR